MTDQTATVEPSGSLDSSTGDHADCSDYHDRATKRKWASADALHRGALASHALSAACQVLHFGPVVDTKPASVAAKAVADELLDWLLESNPPPSEVRDQIDEVLPALENPHSDANQSWLANVLSGAATSDPVDEPDGPAPTPGGVYL